MRFLEDFSIIVRRLLEERIGSSICMCHVHLFTPDYDLSLLLTSRCFDYFACCPLSKPSNSYSLQLLLSLSFVE